MQVVEFLGRFIEEGMESPKRGPTQSHVLEENKENCPRFGFVSTTPAARKSVRSELGSSLLFMFDAWRHQVPMLLVLLGMSRWASQGTSRLLNLQHFSGTLQTSIRDERHRLGMGIIFHSYLRTPPCATA